MVNWINDLDNELKLSTEYWAIQTIIAKQQAGCSRSNKSHFMKTQRKFKVSDDEPNGSKVKLSDENEWNGCCMFENVVNICHATESSIEWNNKF